MKFDPQKLAQMLGEKVPTEAIEYAASTLPDVDDDFFEAYRQKFVGKGKEVLCPICGLDNWEVSPYFGLLVSLRGAGPMGNFPTKDVYVTVKCENCRYSMLFDVRDTLERLKKATDSTG